jgi:signal transduction histidine kinase/CheY-like chemotaxis protein
MVNKAVSESTIESMAELANHDQSSIQGDIESTWEDLTYVNRRLMLEPRESMDEVKSLLGEDADNSFFTNLLLIGTDGQIYADSSGDAQAFEQVDFLQYFANDEPCVVCRLDARASDTFGNKSGHIIYGINLYGEEVAGVPMRAVVGVADVTRIEDRLSIGCFYDSDGSSRGYSAVLEYDGDFVVNVYNNTDPVNNASNVFTRLGNAQVSGMTVDEVCEKIANDESFSFSYTNAEGVKKVAYFMPFPNEYINWYFVSYVQQSVFDDANRTFITLSFVMMLCVIVVLALAGAVQLMASRHVFDARAEARAHSAFLSNMSHEIRTPLNGIIGTMYLLEKDIAQNVSHDVIKAHVEKMKSTSDYLLNLINNVLDISKLQAGKVELREEPASIEVLIDAVYSMQKANMQNRCIEFVLTKEIEYPWVICDETRVEQILMNIVSNAAKFTPVGGRVELGVSQQLEDDGRVASTFVCADTGCGMSAEFLTHIWDNFSQENAGPDGAQKGTGLGMAITKLLVDAMGGQISVESVPGEGSVFTVVIHSAQTEKPQVHSRVLSGTASVHGGRYEKHLYAEYDEDELVGPEKLNILLVEDSDFSAEILAEILEGEGHRVVRAENGQVALDLFAQSAVGEFDIILMDMQMPVMDGCTAARNIRALDRADAQSIVIFACTANTFLEDRVEAQKSGMNDFLSKPVDIDALFIKLRNVWNDEKISK